MSDTRGCVETVPPTILVLPDGNRRWAVENGASYAHAYEQGARRIVECSRRLGSLGLQNVWYGLARPFNFGRSPEEVSAVLDACLKIKSIGCEDGAPFNITLGGDYGLMPEKYQEEFKFQQADHEPGAVTANLLIGWSIDTELANFSGRAPAYPDETIQEQLLRSSAVAEPIGFLIRTGIDTPQGNGGRLSGMVPLHSLDAELHFEPTLWPDFTAGHLDAALEDYATRTHRNVVSL